MDKTNGNPRTLRRRPLIFGIAAGALATGSVRGQDEAGSDWPNRPVVLGFKRSSQHQLAPISVARQRPQQGFATQASCAAGC